MQYTQQQRLAPEVPDESALYGPIYIDIYMYIPWRPLPTGRKTKLSTCAAAALVMTRYIDLSIISNSISIYRIESNRQKYRIFRYIAKFKNYRDISEISRYFYRAMHFSAFARSCDRMSSVCPSVRSSVRL